MSDSAGGRGIGRKGERGVALVALVAAMTIGLIYLMTILPSLSYVAKNEREKELIFRGSQIADAIGRFQQKYGAPPPSLEALVKQKCLRKDFKDPMDPKGEWRIIRLGEPVLCVCAMKGMRTPGIASLPAPRLPGPQGVGPIVGVASRSKEKSIRKFNNCDTYSEWIFSVNCQRSLTFAPTLAPGPYTPGVANGEPLPSFAPLAPTGPQPQQPQRPQPMQPPLLPSGH
jgi:type II secretory pathway pseudopilin PulG